MSQLKRWLGLLGALLLVLLLCAGVLPRLANVPCFAVVRNNLRHDYEATAYFYTELDDFDRWGKALSRSRAEEE